MTALAAQKCLGGITKHMKWKDGMDPEFLRSLK